MTWQNPLIDDLPPEEKDEVVLPNFQMVMYETAIFNIMELHDEEKDEKFWVVEVILFLSQTPPKAITIPLDFGYKFAKPEIALYYIQQQGQVFHNVSRIVTIQNAEKMVVGGYDITVKIKPEPEEPLPEPTVPSSYTIQ